MTVEQRTVPEITKDLAAAKARHAELMRTSFGAAPGPATEELHACGYRVTALERELKDAKNAGRF